MYVLRLYYDYFLPSLLAVLHTNDTYVIWMVSHYYCRSIDELLCNFVGLVTRARDERIIKCIRRVIEVKYDDGIKIIRGFIAHSSRIYNIMLSEYIYIYIYAEWGERERERCRKNTRNKLEFIARAGFDLAI